MQINEVVTIMCKYWELKLGKAFQVTFPATVFVFQEQMMVLGNQKGENNYPTTKETNDISNVAAKKWIYPKSNDRRNSLNKD